MLASLVCNDEAYLVAGGKVQLLAEQDVDELLLSLKSGVTVGLFLGISIWLISYFGSDKAD